MRVYATSGGSSSSATGSHVYADFGPPSGALGVNGDFYLDETGGDVYTKSLGTWTLQTNLNTYVNEQAQDALGTILTDTATINFTYDDITPSVTADVIEAGLTLNNIGGTLGTAKGGTNLTSIGTANQVLGVNSGATGLEYKSISGTSNRLSVTHGAGSVTLNVDATQFPQAIAGNANQVLIASGANTASWASVANANIDSVAAIARSKLAAGTASHVVINDGSGNFSSEANLALTRGGTGSSTGSITGSGALTFAAGGANQNVTLTPSGTGSSILNGSVGVGTTSTVAGGGITIAPSASTSGSPSLFTVTGPAHTTLTASTESNDVNLNLARTVQFATGALTTQRAAYIQAPSYGFVGASTLTTAATLDISGPPKSQTNATITNTYGLLIEAGAVQPAGTVTNSFGLSVSAPTGATNNYAASFIGAVGIGTASPTLAGGGLTIAPSASTTGSPNLLSITGPAHTTLTASTEASDLNINLARQVQFATGALTNQRAVRIQAPTYKFVGASTLTNASTVEISGAPVKGTNATITNTYGLKISSGAVSTATNSFGLYVDAPTGATNNYGAVFNTGNVGVNTNAPSFPLDVLNLNGGGGISYRVSSSNNVGYSNVEHSVGATYSAGISATLNGADTVSPFFGGIAGNGSASGLFFALVGARMDNSGWTDTAGNPAAVSNGQYIPGIAFAGQSNTTVGAGMVIGAAINGIVDNTVTSGACPTAINFRTSVTDSSGLTERMRIGSAGGVSIGTTTIVAGKGLNIAPSATTSGTPSLLSITGPAHTTLTASTEAKDLNINLARTVQFATGAITNQRAVYIQAPTYGFVGASTITNAATLAISGAPVAGTNATLTTTSALLIEAGNIDHAGELKINTAGKGISIKEGTNSRMGTAVLVGGTVTVSTTAVTSSSRIFLTGQADGGTPGFLRITTITAGTSFVITSSIGTDTSTVAWYIVNAL